MMIKAPYYLALFLFSFGIFWAISSKNYLTKLFGLGIMQVGILVFFMAIGKVFGALPPVQIDGHHLYSNTLPQVLMLTAIVVGLATMLVGLALLKRIKREFGSLDEDVLKAALRSDSDSGMHSHLKKRSK